MEEATTRQGRDKRMADGDKDTLAEAMSLMERGDEAFRTGKLGEAISAYEEAVRILTGPDLEDRPDLDALRARAFEWLAGWLAMADRTSECLEASLAASQYTIRLLAAGQFSQARWDLWRAALMTDLGLGLLARGRATEALGACARAEALLDRSSTDGDPERVRLHARLMMTRGKALEACGRFDEAFAALEETARLVDRDGPVGVAWADDIRTDLAEIRDLLRRSAARPDQIAED